MLGKKIPYGEAQPFTSGNANRIFMKKSGDGKSGFERIHNEGFPDIAHTPKFKLSRTDKVFTIGSCFARNIELFLGKIGIDCITTKFTIPDHFYELTGVGARNGALNAYTPQSMLELVRIHSLENKHRIGALQIADDEWCDMLVSGIRMLKSAELDLVRGTILDAYAELPSANVVIITLGYTEAWFDLQDDIFVNRSPGGSMKTARKASRYAFFNSAPTDVLETLDSIVLNINEQTKGCAKIVITVSPVPIHATFSAVDVVSANLYSKSTLLSAAVATATKYEFVSYFPSYELVTFSDPNTTWQGDGVHVNPEVVKKVVQRFVDLYF